MKKHLEDNPQIINREVHINKNSLIKRLGDATSLRGVLFSKDGKVRFVPFGYKTGGQSIHDLENNAYILGRYGEEGAEKIARVAEKYKLKPYVSSFDSTDKEKIRVSGLGSDWFVGGLNVGGVLGGDGDGCAFGADKSGEVQEGL